MTCFLTWRSEPVLINSYQGLPDTGIVLSNYSMFFDRSAPRGNLISRCSKITTKWGQLRVWFAAQLQFMVIPVAIMIVHAASVMDDGNGASNSPTNSKPHYNF